MLTAQKDADRKVISMEQLFEKTKLRMEKCITSLNNDFATIRAGRANPGVLNKVVVDYYGTPTPVQQIAQVSVVEATNLVITPWDVTTLKAIEKAINESDIGINPQNDGKCIRLIFPKLTEERRKEISKDIAKRGEEAKIAVRSVRHDSMDALKKMKKNNEITEDDFDDGEEEIQDITDKYIKECDKIVKDKKDEIMSV